MICFCAQILRMPESDDAALDQIRRLKEMLAQGEIATKQMHELIAELDEKTNQSGGTRSVADGQIRTG